MTAQKIENKGAMLKIEVAIELKGSMLDMENKIQDELNKAGCIATAEALKKFDADGKPLTILGTKMTARKQKASQHYETPYGTVSVERYLYQSNEGGYTYCPLEDGAKIFLTATPRFAKIVSESYAQGAAAQVARNLQSHHHRTIHPAYVAKLSDAVATVAVIKEDKWEYEIPKQDIPVTAIGLGVDGTCIKLAEGGWREAMCGTIALYDKKGERLHTAYIAVSPEHGKKRFHEKMNREIERVKARFPSARVTGLGDGAADNWTFLENHTKNLVLDFWHVSEYVHQASDAYWTKSEKWAESKKEWEDSWFHILKHESGGAQRILDELKTRKEELKGGKSSTVQKAITYIENHLELMNYAREVRQGSPIGSGITESACRLIVKDRLSITGAGWSLEGAETVLTLRALYKSDGHWDTFWSRAMRYGLPNACFFGQEALPSNPHPTSLP